MKEVCEASFYKEKIVLLFKKVIFYLIVSKKSGFLTYTRQRKNAGYDCVYLAAELKMTGHAYVL